mgnify:CR=1 FL=1
MSIELTPIADALVSATKAALRVTAAAYDAEIRDLVSAALDDLKIAGVAADALAAETPDPLIKRAVVTYCKAHFGYDNPDAERFALAYHSLRIHLSLSSEYRQEESA